jgi:hypothetical protein
VRVVDRGLHGLAFSLLLEWVEKIWEKAAAATAALTVYKRIAVIVALGLSWNREGKFNRDHAGKFGHGQNGRPDNPPR